MSTRAGAVRATHAFDLIFGFPCAIEVQSVEKRRRIEIAGMLCLRLADERDASVRWEMFRCVFGNGDDADVELIDPISRRCLRRLVPVVDRLKVNQPRFLPRGVDDVAIRIVEDRHPRLEMGIGLEWVRHVIQKCQARRSAEDDFVVVFVLGEGTIVPLLQGLQVCRIELGEAVRHCRRRISLSSVGR